MTGNAPTPLTPEAAARQVLEAVRSGEIVALLVRLDEEGRRGPEARLLVTADRSLGTLGDPELDRAAVELGRRALDPDGDVEIGVHELPSTPDSRERVYLEVHRPHPELVVVGAGHIAQPLSAVGALLGFRVTVLDDRPDFATRERFPEAEVVQRVDFADPFRDIPVHPLTHLVLVTRGHKYDYECLRRILRMDPQPAYIGMIGSRRRVRATYAQLLEEGIPWERIARVRSPVGLDLGAETPAEIAISVASEIVHFWRGGTGRPLREEERVLERFFEREEDQEHQEEDREDHNEDGEHGRADARNGEAE